MQLIRLLKSATYREKFLSVVDILQSPKFFPPFLLYTDTMTCILLSSVVIDIFLFSVRFHREIMISVIICNNCDVVTIRQEWDVYAVPASSESGSRIPLGWVIPAEPTDEVWASALKH